MITAHINYYKAVVIKKVINNSGWIIIQLLYNLTAGNKSCTNESGGNHKELSRPVVHQQEAATDEHAQSELAEAPLNAKPEVAVK